MPSLGKKPTFDMPRRPDVGFFTALGIPALAAASVVGFNIVDDVFGNASKDRDREQKAEEDRLDKRLDSYLGDTYINNANKTVRGEGFHRLDKAIQQEQERRDGHPQPLVGRRAGGVVNNNNRTTGQRHTHWAVPGWRVGQPRKHLAGQGKHGGNGGSGVDSKSEILDSQFSSARDGDI